MAKIKNPVVAKIIAMGETLPDSYSRPTATLTDEDHDRFAAVFKALGKRTMLKTRIKATDAAHFCDVVQKLIVLE